jgi:hypothetical protein
MAASEEVKALARDFSEFYTMMLSNIARKLFEHLGKEEGKKILSEGLREFGKERGRMIREKADAAGCPPGLEGFIKFYKVPTSAAGKATHNVTGNRRVSQIECAASFFWKKRGEEEIGLLYCDSVDDGMREGFDPRLKHTNPKNPLRGDDTCEHHDFFDFES